MLVKDQMTPNPIFGTPDMPVTKARELMIEKKFRHLPILNDNQEFVGLLTRGTLLKALPSDVSNFSHFEISYVLNKIKAHTIMIKDITTIKEDTPIEKAAQVMADKRIGCLPVLKEGKLVGIITDNDLFNIMVSLLGANQSGIRISVLQPDKVGTVADLTNAIADAGGYLSVNVGYYPKEPSNSWVSVCKVKNITQERLIEIIDSQEDMEILDLREI
ncbi:MAG: CBS domain-containing protein [Chloroflexota bacterium]|nr:CBS domain-containing protein [Chloroflexota bacterium]